MTQANVPDQHPSESSLVKKHKRGGARPNSGKPKGTVHVSPEQRLTKMMRVPASVDPDWLRKLPEQLESLLESWEAEANNVYHRTSPRYERFKKGIAELRQQPSPR